jgi:hypothetical protein
MSPWHLKNTGKYIFDEIEAIVPKE